MLLLRKHKQVWSQRFDSLKWASNPRCKKQYIDEFTSIEAAHELDRSEPQAIRPLLCNYICCTTNPESVFPVSKAPSTPQVSNEATHQLEGFRP